MATIRILWDRKDRVVYPGWYASIADANAAAERIRLKGLKEDPHDKRNGPRQIDVVAVTVP